MSADARFHVHVTKDDLVFSAAHFITFNGDVCERLHGHNYRVYVDVAGPLDENRYVYDFVALREHLRALILEWDHHVLLPTKHPTIRVSGSDVEVIVTHAERRWTFPRGDCVLLPIEQTTAELLAHRLGERLLERLKSEGRPVPEILRIGVDENFGQWAVCELRST